MTIDCYIFDMDGTIADLSHRLHHITKTPKDWRSFFAYDAVIADAPIPHVIDLLWDVAVSWPIVIVSGRSDECWEATMDWINTLGLPVEKLYMRTAGDKRPDNIVKRELLDKVLADGFRPRMVFDDRDQVVAMWREAGIPCAQVAPGSF